MYKHNGMRPQDIVVLLKILTYGKNSWTLAEISKALHISLSEVSVTLERNRIAGLVNQSKKRVNILALRDFLIYGLKYVFPPQVGASVRGILTAHSASPIKEQITAGNDNYVWPYYKGNKRGFSITPLYENIPKFIESDPQLYEYLVIVDTLRVGKTREEEIAIKELTQRFNDYAKQ
jgi:hypothetical protein